MSCQDIDKILDSVQNPGKYSGGEFNSYPVKDSGVKVLLCYPDDYTIGMSSLGYHTVGKIISSHPGFSVERAFSPFPDMEEKMREEGIRLFSIESRRAADEFDIIAFSVHHELSFTNIINMLNLAGIEPFRKEREKGDPLIMAGGPATVNPALLSEFMDILTLGEAEAFLPSLLDLYRKRTLKENFLASAAEIKGIYVPGVSSSVKLAACSKFNEEYFPFDHPVPGVRVPHDRINVEISRGCRKSCRFCQASVIYSPFRSRKPSDILKNASRSVAASGCDEIALTSLSATDHPRVLQIMDDLHYAFSRLGVSVVMPSLRPEDFSGNFASRLSRMRRGGLTFAPETPSAALKKIINKNLDNKKIIKAACRAGKRGWKKLKLYFMIGLPGESLSDIDQIGVFVKKIKKESGINKITVSLSVFTPQPHTPFQWSVPESPDKLNEKEKRLKKVLKQDVRGINLKSHIISSVLCRADSSLGMVVYEAFREGARLDQWGEHFDPGAWDRAFKKCGIDLMELYLKEFPLDKELPWDMVETGPGRAYLQKSYRAALKLIEERKSG